MKNYIFLILFFLILFAGGAIFVFILKPQRDRLISKNEDRIVSVDISPGQSGVNNTGNINFIETGNIVNTDPLISSEGPDFSLLYEKPGKPALKVKLIINNNSKCILEDVGIPCNQMQLHVGNRVKIEGIKESDNVQVLLLNKTS